MYKDLKMSWIKGMKIPISVMIRVNEFSEKIVGVEINGTTIQGELDIPNKNWNKK